MHALVRIYKFSMSKVFQADAGGGHTSLLFQHVSSCACKNTRAFPSRECFGHMLVVKHELFYLVIVVLANTCGEHTSFLSKEFQACACGECANFLISGVLIKMAFVVYTQTFRSRRFQVCACGAQAFSL